MKTLAIACIGLVCGMLGTAQADTPPSAWDRAVDPAVGERYRLHLHIVELLHPPLPGGRDSEDSDMEKLMDLWRERARAELEQASAATSPDVRLRLDLGEVYEELGRHEEAIAVLKPALTMVTDETAASGWEYLAYAYAHLDRFREERDAYDAILRLSTDERTKMNSRLNRSEAEMRLGNLDEAVDGYREIVEYFDSHGAMSQGDWKTAVLARWGLAVALDRDGDPVSAAREAALAAETDPNEYYIKGPGVFFVPAYEVCWYLGLGRAEHAKREQDPWKALELWSKVTQTWTAYVTHAAPNDRWLPLARSHMAQSERERVAAEKRVGNRKPPAPAPSLETSITFPGHLFPAHTPRAPVRVHP